MFWKKAIPQLKKEGVTYEPDVWAVASRSRRRHGQIDIYEVWHTQSWEKGFTDLINSVLVEDLGHIQIVVIKRKRFRDPWVEKYVKMIKKILNKVLNVCGKRRLKSLTVVEIDDEYLKRQNRKKLEKKIQKKFHL